MEESALAFFTGGFGMVIGIVILLWCVLMLFAPFFWYGTNRRTRETVHALNRLIQLQRAQLDLMEESAKKRY